MKAWGIWTLMWLVLSAGSLSSGAVGQSGGPHKVVADTTSWSLSVGPVASAHMLALVVLGEAAPQGDSAARNTTVSCGFLSGRPVLDTDGDGIPDDQDGDIDFDGIPNDEDQYVYDTDNDGLHNFADTDDDGDLLMDGEELVWGTHPLLADTDGDTFDDGTEVRVLRTSPTDPLDCLQVGNISIGFGAIVVNWLTKPSVLYYVQRLSSLRTGAWEDIAGPLVGTGGWISLTNPISGPTYFYRVRVGP